LAIPLPAGIGKHELRGKGRGLYHDLFGSFYYSFTMGKNYFIVLDDANGKGLDLKQKRWLERELTKSGNYGSRIVFMHVPLYDPRGENYHHCLPEKSAYNLINLFLKYRITHIFTSHIHGFFAGKWKGIPYAITGGAGGSLAGDNPDHYYFHFLKVHIKNGNMDVQVIRVPAPYYEHYGPLVYMAWVYISDFLRFYGIQTVLLLIAGGLALVIYRGES